MLNNMPSKREYIMSRINLIRAEIGVIQNMPEKTKELNHKIIAALHIQLEDWLNQFHTEITKK